MYSILSYYHCLNIYSTEVMDNNSEIKTNKKTLNSYY